MSQGKPGLDEMIDRLAGIEPQLQHHVDDDVIHLLLEWQATNVNARITEALRNGHRQKADRWTNVAHGLQELRNELAQDVGLDVDEVLTDPELAELLEDGDRDG